MKTVFITICLATAIWSCQSAAEKTPHPGKDSSLLAVIPPPQLDPVEARRYHDLVSDFVEKNLSARYYNGGILVAKKGVIVYERYTGFSNLKTKDSMDAETSLQIASTGKTLTAAGILKLVQEGKLHLDDLVMNLFPGFPYPEVTVKMLLNHRSGIPEYLYYMEKMGWNRKVTATNGDVMRTLIEWKPARSFTPGTRFTYCNTNFVILASIIEKVSGIPYAQYMKANFFTPLGMDHTFVRTPADSANVNFSYQPNGALWVNDYTDGPVGDKNIYSTPRDLLKWDQELYAGRIIRQALLDSAFTPYSNEKAGVKNYGLGWHLLMLPNEKKVIYHNGRWHGFNSAFARLTDEQVTIIMTSNKYNRGVYSASKNMYNLFGPYDGKGEDNNREEEAGGGK